MTTRNDREIRVLVIDDSAFNRQTITAMLEQHPGIRVVARAADGDDGLKQVFAHHPDVITLDLEMPKMDGFTFLRILMSRRPTPVLVISSYARRENVFKALELGALDFIAKPTQKISPELREIETELVEKIKLVTRLRPVTLIDRLGTRAPATPAPPADFPPRTLRKLVAIGASTGGPPALTQVLTGLDPQLPAAVVVAQHMPAKFTQAFAERLDRACALEVREARHGDALRPGLVLIAPGAGTMTVVRIADGQLRVRVEPSLPDDRFAPSIDRLFESVAESGMGGVVGVVLTGMAGDGARGVRAIKDKGGLTIAESAETAVIFGMPEDAIKTGAVDEVLPLSHIAAAVNRACGTR
jgi:two-component system, chemotaxis family, protein-glutamate methylesterase/glutaminase